MDLMDAIKEVLAVKRAPMHYDEITKILRTIGKNMLQVQ